MFDLLLLPVDLSDANGPALRQAQQLGTPGETRIELLHVIETLHDDEPGEMDDFYDELQQEAEERLEGWAAELGEAGFDVETLITYGERAPEIAHVAEEEETDLIVMRSRLIDRDDPERSVGTVSHQVAVFAPCSVHLVRTTGSPEG